MDAGEIENAKLDLALAKDSEKKSAWVERWAEPLLLDAEALATGGQMFDEGEISQIEQDVYDDVADKASEIADNLDKTLAILAEENPSLKIKIGDISEIVSELREL